MLPQYKPHSSANTERAEFAKRLVKMLRERDMNQSDLARAAGLSRDAISSYTRARSMPEPKNLRAIAEALKCDPADLTLRIETDPTTMHMPLLMEEEKKSGATAAAPTRNEVAMAMDDEGNARILINAKLPVEVAMQIVRSYREILRQNEGAMETIQQMNKVIKAE